MDDLQREKLKDVCVVICEGFGKAAESMKAAVSALAESIAGLDLEITCILEESPRDPFEDLMLALKAMSGDIDKEKLQEFAELAQDMPPLLPSKKIHRPPKCLGQVNRANYTANKPPRRARSNCRIIKR